MPKKLSSFKFLLNEIHTDKQNIEKRIDNLFKNYFKKSVHCEEIDGEVVLKEYLKQVKELTKFIYNDDLYKSEGEEPLKDVNLYSLLRANKLIREDIK